MTSDSFVYNWVPLKKQPWTLPKLSENETEKGPSHGFWTIDSILSAKGIQVADIEAKGILEEDWEKELITEAKPSKEKHSLKKSKNSEDSVYQQVLDEYWDRIYEKSWQRCNVLINSWQLKRLTNYFFFRPQ